MTTKAKTPKTRAAKPATGKASKKAAVRATRAPRSPKTAPPARTATPAVRPASAPEKAPRAGTKQASLIAMLQRADGATIEEIVAATGWQAHTVRGAISGALKKKLGLNVESATVEERGRVYRIVD